MKKIEYENWRSAIEKWIGIMEKIKQGEELLWRGRFNGLRVVGECGYCSFHQTCLDCVLYKTFIFNRRVCSAGPIKIVNSYFWLFVREMQKEKINFYKAHQYAEKVFISISQDCPDKRRALNDGIAC